MYENLNYSSDEFNFEPILDFENDLNSSSDIRVLKPESDIGIETLPNQYVKRFLKSRDYSFNIMLLGPTGIGKSTLIDSLFKTKFTNDLTETHSLSKVEVVSHYYDLKEKDITLKLGVIECKGFEDQLIKDNSYKPVIDYIDQQFDKYLEEELRIVRSPQITDTRVNVCLYLISPLGYGLKDIDLLTMKKLDTKVNLIPLIAKSDVLTKPELTELKAKIKIEIESNRINTYDFSTNESNLSLDESFDSFINIIPFAVIASNQFILIGETHERARQYPWGTVEVENKSHSDLHIFREMFIRHNLHDLKESTHNRFYQYYRSQRLEELWKVKQLEHTNGLKAKEQELIDNFTAKLRSKEIELKKSEKELHLKFEKLNRERIEEKMRLDLMRNRLEEDIQSLKARKQLLANKKVDKTSDKKQLSSPKLR